MVGRASFIASPPAGQHDETYRQFLQLQTYLQELERRIQPVTFEGQLIISDPLDPVTWVPVTLSPVPALDEGVFYLSASIEITGVGGAGFIQFRINGVEGKVWDASENITRQIETDTFFAGPTDLVVEVRGENVEENDGVYDAFRVGAA